MKSINAHNVGFLAESWNIKINEESSFAKSLEEIESFTIHHEGYPEWIRLDDRPYMKRPQLHGSPIHFWVKRESDGLWVPAGRTQPDNYSYSRSTEEQIKGEIQNNNLINIRNSN